MKVVISDLFPNDRSNYHSGFGTSDATGTIWYADSPQNTTLNVSEKGAVDQYNFAFATNISNSVFLGATLAVTDINYSISSIYDERFEGGIIFIWIMVDYRRYRIFF